MKMYGKLWKNVGAFASCVSSSYSSSFLHWALRNKCFLVDVKSIRMYQVRAFGLSVLWVFGKNLSSGAFLVTDDFLSAGNLIKQKNKPFLYVKMFWWIEFRVLGRGFVAWIRNCFGEEGLLKVLYREVNIAKANFWHIRQFSNNSLLFLIFPPRFKIETNFSH